MKRLLLSDPTHDYTKLGLEANRLQVGGRERRASGKRLQLQSQTSPVPVTGSAPDSLCVLQQVA